MTMRPKKIPPPRGGRKSTEPTIGAEELCELLQLSRSTLAAHALKGDVIRAKARGRYMRDASITKYVVHLRVAASGRGSPSSEARVALLEAQAAIAQDKRAAARKDLVPAVDVVAEWSRICRLIKNGVLAAPVRCAARLPHLTKHDLATLDGELRVVLTELGQSDDAA